jgi:hypothetical protein
MPSRKVADHGPQVPPQVHVILARVTERCWRVRGQHWKESEEGHFFLNGRERMHAFDAMRHWQDPVEKCRTLRRRRRTLIDDNPPSG